MSREAQIIDERKLAEFRNRELAAPSLYRQIPRDDRVLLINLPPGVGKSHRAQGLIRHALEADYGLVIFVAPTRAIIGELEIVRSLSADKVVVLKAGPRRLCGTLNAPWSLLERSGCAALGKSTLCEGCPQLDRNGGACGWPDQMERIGKETRLVVLTEQYLHLNPLLIRSIRRRVGTPRRLVIFDEALFMTSSVVRRFTKADLERFRTALAEARGEVAFAATGIRDWIEGIDFILDQEVDLRALRRFWRNKLEFAVLATQRAGNRLFGENFRYLASDLELLNSTVTTGQWRDADTYEIVVRVDTTRCDVVVLAAYLESGIVEERLSRPVKELLPGQVFRHSATRIINIADPIGAARTLPHPDHFSRVVDFFLALALRNAAQGRRTVLITRKRFLGVVQARIESTSTTLGRPLTCVLPSSGRSLGDCRPIEIPLINYGIVGINSLQNFDAVYCIGGYYSRTDHLNAVYQQSLSPDCRMPIAVRTENRRRIVYAADGRYSTRYHARRAEVTHRMLERRTVLQAIGRVRPFTSPAEIILFQCDDFSAELGPIEEFSTLAGARRSLRVPTTKRMRRAALGEQVRARQAAGIGLRTIAAEFGVAPSTASLAGQHPDLAGLLSGIRQ
jgi:hypothetical protein